MDGTMRFQMELGALTRRAVINELKLYCHENDVEIDLVEGKGLISSTYSIKLKGDAGCLYKIKLWLSSLADES